MWRLVESDFADILITDVGLPDGDALDVLPKLQKLKPNLKIIVMSARTTLLTAVRAEKKEHLNIFQNHLIWMSF